MASQRGLPREISVANPELFTYAELVEMGYLDGWVTIKSNNEPVKVADLKITQQGEEFLERQGSHLVLRRRVLKKKMNGFVECVVGFLLIFIFFVFLKITSQIGGETSDKIALKNDGLFKTTQQFTHAAQKHPMNVATWTFGVCGLPPLE